MKGGIFNSIYFLAFIAALIIFLPFAFWLDYEFKGVFLAQRRSLEKQTALSVLNRVQYQGQPNTYLLLDQIKNAVETANVTQKEFQFLNAGIYLFSETREPGRLSASGAPGAGVSDAGRFVFKLSESHAQNVLNRPPESFVLAKGEIMNLGRQAGLVSHFWLPIPYSESPNVLLAVTTRDNHLNDLLGDRRIAFAVSSSFVFLLFFGVISMSIYVIIKKPLIRLQSTLLNEEESVENLSAGEFGDFGDLVQALKTYVDRTRSFVSTAENVDPVTGLMSGQTAMAAYLESHHRPDEIYAVFFRANFGKEYVKKFGRSFRDKILRISGTAVAAGIPSGSRLFAVQDHFLLTFLTEGAFHQCYAQVQKNFNRAIRPLYEDGEGRDVQMMTLSAAGISNKSVGYEAFHDLLQKLHDDWNSLVNKPRAGWALMNADDQWVKGTPDDQDGAGEAEVIPEEPESLKDPLFARKVFIVKLAFMFQFDPQKASKLYKLGYTRLTALMADDAPESVKKYGMEADVRELVRKMRLVPKSRLYYNETDFKQVFVTDVRMVKKIPREIAGRWFAAGFRRLEDIADADADSLMKIDGSASREDVQAVVDHARTLAAPAKGGA